MLSMPQGVVRTRDVRVLADDGPRWKLKFVMQFGTAFEQCVDPTEQLPDTIVIEPGIVAHDVLPPEVETVTTARRMRLTPSDFLTHGYTARCPGRINLRRMSEKSRNDSEACRLRICARIFPRRERSGRALVATSTPHLG